MESDPAATSGAKRSAERAADRRLVEQTLALLAEHERVRNAGERAIGEHVLDGYFGGDAALAKSKSPVKARSFALLAERAEKEAPGWDERALLRATRIAVAWRSLGARVRGKLTGRQLEKLASIEDVGGRRRLAARIAAGELKGARVDTAIADEGKGERRGGRAAAPSVVRATASVERALEGVDARGVARGLDERARTELAARLRRASRRLAQLADRLDSTDTPDGAGPRRGGGDRGVRRGRAVFRGAATRGRRRRLRPAPGRSPRRGNGGGAGG